MRRVREVCFLLVRFDIIYDDRSPIPSRVPGEYRAHVSYTGSKLKRFFVRRIFVRVSIISILLFYASNAGSVTQMADKVYRQFRFTITRRIDFH